MCRLQTPRDVTWTRQDPAEAIALVSKFALGVPHSPRRDQTCAVGPTQLRYSARNRINQLADLGAAQAATEGLQRVSFIEWFTAELLEVYVGYPLRIIDCPCIAKERSSAHVLSFMDGDMGKVPVNEQAHESTRHVVNDGKVPPVRHRAKPWIG